MDLMFLTDDTDTILAYEQRGRENKPTVSSYESGIQALQNMGRIPQVEVIQGRSEECNRQYQITVIIDLTETATFKTMIRRSLLERQIYC